MPKIVSTTHLAAAIALAQFSSTNAAAHPAKMPSALQAKIEAARSECANFENGEFAIEIGAIQRVDLDGDGQEDWVVNEGRFACSSGASLYGGTGGSMSHFVVGGQVTSILNQGWEVARFGPHTVVLARVHGSQCGGINPTPCIASSVWDKEAKAWRSTSAVWDQASRPKTQSAPERLTAPC